MTTLFFYGTLRHRPLLEIVLGRPLDTHSTRPAALADHAVYAAAEGPYPVLVTAPGAEATGLCVSGLSAQDIARISFYEAGFAFELRRVTLTDGQAAEVYFPIKGSATARQIWDLAAWERDWATLSCHAAREVMDYHGVYSAERVARMFPMIRTRAAAMVNAEHSKHGAGTLFGRVEVERLARSYTNFFALNEYRLRHERFDGSMSQMLDRAVFVASDAALVLPYDPVRDRVLIVEQFRMGPVARGDRALWQMEPIAGRVDPGETPEEAAHREAQEEAGISLQTLERVAEVYASPGDSSEFFYIFVGLADLPDKATGIGGLHTENEDIRSHLLSFEALMQMVDRFEAANTPLVIAAYWLARHRERLRLHEPPATPEAS